jgi:hypothetical protein
MSILLEPDILRTLQELADNEQRTPSEILADALDLYILEKLDKSQNLEDSPAKRKMSGAEFLLAIAGIGDSEEDDVSERDEEILRAGVDPIRGWRLPDRYASAGSESASNEITSEK